MKRICLIGDSHIAALRLGWQRIRARYPHVEIDFFGGAGSKMKKLRSDKRGALVPASEALRQDILLTSGGLDRIVLADYDAFALVGMGFGLIRLFHLSKFQRTIDMIATVQPPHLISNEVFQRACMTSLRNCRAVQIAREIRTQSKRPIVLIRQPYYSQEVLRERDRSVWNDAAVAGPKLEAEMERFIAVLEQKRGIKVAPYPEETRVERYFTAPAYASGSIRMLAGFDTLHEVGEYRHMNPLFGERVMELLLPTFGPGFAEVSSETPLLAATS
ncbi:MAG TPA: hypothetical protein VGC51_12465 [Hansschlegelia sp.]